jgi:hypothetical protein
MELPLLALGVGRDDEKEPDADGRVLLRPEVPFYTRRSALEQMARVVRSSPPTTRRPGTLRWFPEPPGKDVWQTPHETERLGGGDCEDLEMHAARAALDGGERDVQLCMTVGAAHNEHVFGLRQGAITDQSAAGGMPPLPASRYQRRVCVRVDEDPMQQQQMRKTGGSNAALTTGGPSLDTSDFAVHGIAHWRAVGWERAAAGVAQMFPQSRPLYMRVLPAIKSCASYFSSLYISAWDQAGNEARLHRAAHMAWQNERAERLLRYTYYQQGGQFADYILQFERQYHRPPTDHDAVKAAVRAFVFASTAQEWPNWRAKLGKYLTVVPRSMETAALQIIVRARGLFPHDAFPVPPFCPECAHRRGSAGPVVTEPEQVDITNVYAPPAGAASPTAVQPVIDATGLPVATDTSTLPTMLPVDMGVASLGAAAFGTPAVAAVAAPSALPLGVVSPGSVGQAVAGQAVGQALAGGAGGAVGQQFSPGAGSLSSPVIDQGAGSNVTNANSGNTTIVVEGDQGDDTTGDGTDDGSGDTGDEQDASSIDEFGLLGSSGPDDDDDDDAVATGGTDDLSVMFAMGDDDDLKPDPDDGWSYVAAKGWEDEEQGVPVPDDDDDLGHVTGWTATEAEREDVPLNDDFIGEFDPPDGDIAGDIAAAVGADEAMGDLFSDPGQFDDPESWFATDDECEDGSCAIS